MARCLVSMILLLAACDALAPPAPYRLAIALGGHRVAEAPLDCHDGDATLELPAGEREASDRHRAKASKPATGPTGVAWSSDVPRAKIGW